MPAEVPAKVPTKAPAKVSVEIDAGWSVFEKGLFFGVIIAAVALYMKLSKRRSDPIYEKGSNLA